MKAINERVTTSPLIHMLHYSVRTILYLSVNNFMEKCTTLQWRRLLLDTTTQFSMVNGKRLYISTKFLAILVSSIEKHF